MIRRKIATYADDTVTYFYDKVVANISDAPVVEFNFFSSWLRKEAYFVNNK